MLLKDNNFEGKKLKKNLKRFLQKGCTVEINNYTEFVRGKHNNGGCYAYFSRITYDNKKHCARIINYSSAGDESEYVFKISADKLATQIIDETNSILDYEKEVEPAEPSYLEVWR